MTELFLPKDGVQVESKSASRLFQHSINKNHTPTILTNNTRFNFTVTELDQEAKTATLVAGIGTLQYDGIAFESEAQTTFKASWSHIDLGAENIAFVLGVVNNQTDNSITDYNQDVASSLVFPVDLDDYDGLKSVPPHSTRLVVAVLQDNSGVFDQTATKIPSELMIIGLSVIVLDAGDNNLLTNKRSVVVTSGLEGHKHLVSNTDFYVDINVDMPTWHSFKLHANLTYSSNDSAPYFELLFILGGVNLPPTSTNIRVATLDASVTNEFNEHVLHFTNPDNYTTLIVDLEVTRFGRYIFYTGEILWLLLPLSYDGVLPPGNSPQVEVASLRQRVTGYGYTDNYDFTLNSITTNLASFTFGSKLEIY